MSSTPQPPLNAPNLETRAMPPPPSHHRVSTASDTLVEFVSPLTTAPLQWRGDALIGPQGEAVPVVRGIPRFVSSDLYASGFGLQWNAHAETQLDSRTGTHLSRNRLERCLGMPLTALDGKTVLEAGCGAGRFTELMVQAGALVHAIDLSAAVDANRRNIGPAPNYVVAQADIRACPFPPGSFDVVACIGVLQHTPSPEASIGALWNMVKPGGLLAIDHYTWTLSRMTKLTPLYRLVLKRLRPATAKRITDRLVSLFFPLHWRVRRVPWVQRLLSRISPCLAYCHVMPELTREQHYDWCRLDTFDELTDYYKHFRTCAQIRRILVSCGAERIEVSRRGVVVEARCRRPDAPSACVA
jgi:SAM-dependent methyltransferase